MKLKGFINNFSLLISLFCLASMYVFPEVTKEAVMSSLALCAKSVIPSLFPFIVCTRIVIYFYSCRSKKNESHSILPVISLSKNGIIAFVPGLISGFPTGAAISGQMYSSGLISIKEAEKIAVFSSVAGPSFCMVFFGNYIMHGKFYGFAVYIASVLSTVGLLILYNFIFENKQVGNDNYSNTESTEKYSSQNTSSLTEVITDSCLTVINICAYVTFFTCIGEIFTRTASFFLPELNSKKAYICGFLELTGGTAALEEFEFSKRLLTGALLIGFSGLSAILQVTDICCKYNINCGKIFLVKFISAFTVPALTFLIVALSGFMTDINYAAIITKLLFSSALIILLLVCLKFFAEKRKKNIRKAKLISKI